MATGTDCVIGVYGDGVDEQIAGSLTKKIDDIIDAHDAIKCHVCIALIEGLSTSAPQAMAIIYWAD